MRSLSANVALMMPPDPIHNQSYQDMARSIKPPNDPETPPPKKPGDSFLVTLTLLGLVVGGVLGYVLAFFFLSPRFSLVSAALFGLVCAIVGLLAGDAVKKRKARRLQRSRLR